MEERLRGAAQTLLDCIDEKGLSTQVGQKQCRMVAEALAAPPPKPKAAKADTKAAAKKPVAKKSAKQKSGKGY